MGGEAGPLDTGVIVALLDRSEKMHEACAETVRELQAPLVTCEAMIAESCYLLRTLSGAPEAVIESIVAGIVQIPFRLSRECAGVKHLLRKYRDRKIDLADACLIRLADEFGTADILTLGRDFAIYRSGKNKPFRMLPRVSATKVKLDGWNGDRSARHVFPGGLPSRKVSRPRARVYCHRAASWTHLLAAAGRERRLSVAL